MAERLPRRDLPYGPAYSTLKKNQTPIVKDFLNCEIELDREILDGEAWASIGKRGFDAVRP